MTTLSAVFWKLVSMSLAASVFVLLACLVRPLTKRLPKRVNCILWIFCLVRLLCPFSFRGGFSLLPRRVAALAADVSGGADSAVLAAEHAIGTVSEALGGAAPAGSETMASAGSAAPFALSFAEVLPIIWLAGVLVFAAAALLSALRLRKRLADRVPADPAAVSGPADPVRSGLPARVRVYTVPGLGSAFVAGVFRPRVYLPGGLSETERRCVLAHESAHLRHGDPLWKALAFGALMLHWANPLVWLAFRLFGSDMEMAADEDALDRTRGIAKADYSQIILNSAAGRSGLPLSSIAFGSGSVKGRIRNVLAFRKIPRTVSTALLTLALLCGTMMLWDPPAAAVPNVSEMPDAATAPDFPRIPEQETLPGDSVERVPPPAKYGEVPFDQLLPEYQEYYLDQELDRQRHEGLGHAMAEAGPAAPPEETKPSGAMTQTPAPAENTAPPVAETPTRPAEPAPAETPAAAESAAPAETHTVFVVDLKSLRSAGSADAE